MIPLRSVAAAAVYPERSGSGYSQHLVQTQPEQTETTHSEVNLAVLEAHEIDSVDALHFGGTSWLEGTESCGGCDVVCQAC